ncbi:MAG: alpha/beta hydrolase [Bacteroidota bacterium]
MKRRTFFQTSFAASLPFSFMSNSNQAVTEKPKTYVLVPGTWHGGWVWQDVKGILQAKGHRVYTPTPTGVGERSHLLTPDVDLYTHINDIANVIKWEELEDVILVGYSFSGITITGVADELKDKIKHIVFYDALVPRAGTMKAWPNESSPLYESYEKRRANYIDGYKMDFFQDYTLDMLINEGYPEIRAKLKRLLTYHPLGQWITPLVLKNGGYDDLPKTYIRCAGQKHRPSSDWMPGPAKSNPDWNWIELPISRSGMLTHPELVAECFLNID